MKIAYRKIFGDNFIDSKPVDKLKEFMLYKKHPEIKPEIKKNAELKDKYKGKRCFILGNGPSLANLDFSRLANEYTFSVNQLPRNPKFPDLKTNFHVWTDERFFIINENNEEDMELIEVMKAVNSGGNSPIVFYKSSGMQMVKDYRLEKILNIRFFSEGTEWRGSVSTAKMKRGFIDITRCIPNMPTVVQSAVFIAVHMGFSDIYLLGCDCSGFITAAQTKMKKAEESLYAYDISENEKRRMERLSGVASIRDELYSFAKLFDRYEELFKYCNKYGVRLYNATSGGLLEELPRVDIDDVLRNKEEST